MQEGKLRRSNAERSDTMRASLVAAARSLFVEKGYADTGTPEIVEAAGVTRGALYHHFADKKALFEAVVRSESATVGSEVQNAAPTSAAPAQAVPAPRALVRPAREWWPPALSAPAAQARAFRRPPSAWRGPSRSRCRSSGRTSGRTILPGCLLVQP